MLVLYVVIFTIQHTIKIMITTMFKILLVMGLLTLVAAEEQQQEHE